MTYHTAEKSMPKKQVAQQKIQARKAGLTVEKWAIQQKNRPKKQASHTAEKVGCTTKLEYKKSHITRCIGGETWQPHKRRKRDLKLKRYELALQ